MKLFNHAIAIAIAIAALAISGSLTITGFAQAQSTANDYVDHPLLASFPDAEIVDIEILRDVNYRMILGSLQRTSGQVVPVASERLRGDVTKIVYEIPQEYAGDDVYQFYRELMIAEGYSEMFTCLGRACGSSNYWANDIFKNRILYGPERNQFYLAMRPQIDPRTAAEGEAEPFISAYILTRGNRRIYAYFEIVEPGGASMNLPVDSASSLLAGLLESGTAVIPSIIFDDEDQLRPESDLGELITLLRADSSMRVYLVAHLSGDQPLATLMQRSSVRAEQLRQRLIEFGFPANRIDAQGVGPLSPSCGEENCGDRIELVLR